MQAILGIPIAYLVLVLEIIVLIALLIGWRYGASKKNFDLHHKAVYLVVLIHILTVGLWMIPRALERLSFMLSNPIANWYQIVHDVVGILAIGLGILLVLVFLVKSGMPLKLLKRTRPLMFLTIGVWILAFVLGVYWFLIAWIWI
ncbi:MAG: hypothetical protein KGD60_10610 [Candidatus Thorarchaeota archaeon]|nr:hypothetical protein [Candidatus Thorarchaeota archaeon]